MGIGKFCCSVKDATPLEMKMIRGPVDLRRRGIRQAVKMWVQVTFMLNAFL